MHFFSTHVTRTRHVCCTCCRSASTGMMLCRDAGLLSGSMSTVVGDGQMRQLLQELIWMRGMAQSTYMQLAVASPLQPSSSRFSVPVYVSGTLTSLSASIPVTVSG
ncbi:hypothetical protein PoB_001040800 [Plakobranchus ocellatus]|uniref:Uncharacterized protein n=1 Tax=Plakobranchus ocellatus TaxID=259542 RepID=A0AAV3YNQ2_9GAST|nr:hypothetical protein PoB_001040800 [Plakobranchus ocellatus]